jgi:hypothetical protein
MLSAKIKVSPSLKKKLAALEENAEAAVKERLTDIARYATSISPVDTGAYVTSFSYAVGAGRPRGKSSKGKPRGQNPQAMREEGFGNLVKDLNRMPSLKDSTSIVLRNGSPHAPQVENKHGYYVFTRVRNLYG